MSEEKATRSRRAGQSDACVSVRSSFQSSETRGSWGVRALSPRVTCLPGARSLLHPRRLWAECSVADLIHVHGGSVTAPFLRCGSEVICLGPYSQLVAELGFGLWPCGSPALAQKHPSPENTLLWGLRKLSSGTSDLSSEEVEPCPTAGPWGRTPVQRASRGWEPKLGTVFPRETWGLSVQKPPPAVCSLLRRQERERGAASGVGRCWPPSGALGLAVGHQVDQRKGAASGGSLEPRKSSGGKRRRYAPGVLFTHSICMLHHSDLRLT